MLHKTIVIVSAYYCFRLSRIDIHTLRYHSIPLAAVAFGIEREDSMLAAEASRGELLHSNTSKIKKVKVYLTLGQVKKLKITHTHTANVKCKTKMCRISLGQYL